MIRAAAVVLALACLAAPAVAVPENAPGNGGKTIASGDDAPETNYSAPVAVKRPPDRTITVERNPLRIVGTVAQADRPNVTATHFHERVREDDRDRTDSYQTQLDVSTERIGQRWRFELASAVPSQGENWILVRVQDGEAWRHDWFNVGAVDTEPPVLSVQPGGTAPLGYRNLAVTAHDDVGIDRLAWRVGEEGWSIETYPDAGWRPETVVSHSVLVSEDSDIRIVAEDSTGAQASWESHAPTTPTPQPTVTGPTPTDTPIPTATPTPRDVEVVETARPAGATPTPTLDKPVSGRTPAPVIETPTPEATPTPEPTPTPKPLVQPGGSGLTIAAGLAAVAGVAVVGRWLL